LEEVVGLDISYHDGSFYESEPEHIQAYGKRKVAKKHSSFHSDDSQSQSSFPQYELRNTSLPRDLSMNKV